MDIAKAKRDVYGSADPLDIAFRICIQEIFEWVKDRIFAKTKEEELDEESFQRWLEELVLLIVDDCEKNQRAMLQNSFRNLRHPAPTPGRSLSLGERFAHFHDDVFFGDSRYSVGIQIADLCSYFIARHLNGDEEIRPFYELIEPYIVYGQFYPDEKQFKAPQPVLSGLSNLRLALSGLGNEKQRIPEVRQDDAEIAVSSPLGDQEEAGRGEAREEAEKEPTV